MSFGALRANGALERTVEGRARLVQIAAGMPEEGNDRPRWNFPRNAAFWSPETMRFVTEAQDLLIQLGPVMVREGLLAE